MFSVLGDTIAVCKIQHQRRSFATDIAQNTVELYLKIQEEISFPQANLLLQIKSSMIQIASGLEPYLMLFPK